MKRLLCVIALLAALCSFVPASEPNPQTCTGPDGITYPWGFCPKPLSGGVSTYDLMTEAALDVVAYLF